MIKMSVRASSAEICLLPVSKLVAFLAPNINMSNPEKKDGIFHLKEVLAHKCVSWCNFLNFIGFSSNKL